MNTTGILSIGNGEKCPYCELIITEDIDALVHMTAFHKEELNKVLFGGDNDKS